MKRTIVVYYSRTGNNRYLAERIAKRLSCDIEPIRPRLGSFPLILLSSILKTGLGIRALKHNLDKYDRIILCGPIWMGQLLAPLRDLLVRCRNSSGNLCFATCCGGGDAEKDSKFGYAQVFATVQKLGGGRGVDCEAFPITLVVPKDKLGDGQAVMKTRLSDENFTGEILRRFDGFVERVAS